MFWAPYSILPGNQQASFQWFGTLPEVKFARKREQTWYQSPGHFSLTPPKNPTWTLSANKPSELQGKFYFISIVISAPFSNIQILSQIKMQ